MARAIGVALFMLFAGVAGAQTDLPHNLKDNEAQDTADFLYREMLKNKRNTTFAKIDFTDGTTQTTAASTDAGFHCSTAAVDGTVTFSQTIFALGFATVTHVAAEGDDLFVMASFTAAHDTANNFFYCSFLVDGSPLGGVNDNGILNGVPSGNGFDENMSMAFVDLDVSAGSHSYAITCRVGSGAGKIDALTNTNDEANILVCSK